MNIAINAQLLSTEASYRSAGVSNYSRHLVTALGELAGEEQFADLSLSAFVHTRTFSATGVEFLRSRLPLHKPMARILWEQTMFPLLLRGYQADVVHGLVNVLPLATTLPGVVTVHDLSFVRTPEAFPAAKRWYLTQLCRASVQKAQHVIAVSRQTADDLMNFFAVPAHKISVIYNGISGHFSPQHATAVAALRAQYDLPARFFLYLGTLEPRKNLPLLIRAYAQWRAQAKATDRDVKLVLAGGKGWFYAEIFQLVTDLELTDCVRFPGYIPEAELPIWYSAATAFIYPSRFEGFGLPVLEAMACGTPVLCSDIPILREIADGHALFFPVEDATALANLLQRTLVDATLQESLTQAGFAHVAKFSWQHAARATAAIYTRLAHR
ncbi:MAG: glycosyltransferase family 4 protein [Caldilineaceae bacterium]|nr:glycosyltransferase family 4 protein [Caldilineaceae bacterium]